MSPIKPVSARKAISISTTQPTRANVFLRQQKCLKRLAILRLQLQDTCSIPRPTLCDDMESDSVETGIESDSISNLGSVLPNIAFHGRFALKFKLANFFFIQYVIFAEQHTDRKQSAISTRRGFLQYFAQSQHHKYSYSRLAREQHSK